MKIKNKYKKIFLLLVIILISGLLLNSTYAAITLSGGIVGTDEGDVVNAVGIAAEAIYKILEMPVTGMLAPITWTIVLLAVILWFVLWVVFAIGTGSVLFIPTPDVIVFNRFAFFDANFINPANNSLLSKLEGILGNLFESFQTVAIALFVVAAMVAGIKMALSTIAAKKAQYKEAAMKWVTGFIILLCLKYLIAGIFYLNEYLVATLYGIVANIEIKFNGFEMIPVYGGMLGDLADIFDIGNIKVTRLCRHNLG